MPVLITNLYSNEVPDKSQLKGDHGQSFLIETNKKKILFDVGAKSDILLHNMKLLDIDPNVIDLLVLSHGHYDHTAALPGFLDARNENKLKVIAHPNVKEEKFAKLLFVKKPLGFPELSEDQERKIDFIFTKEPYQLCEGISTTGEITIRPHIDGTEEMAFHKTNNHTEVDPVLDDLSIVIETPEGKVIIAGCAHAGILNICEHVSKNETDRILTIMGGTHMVRYKREEVIFVADQLESRYNNPRLFLNHCTEHLPIPFVKKTKAISILKENLKEGIVNKCDVGFSMKFETV